MKATNMEKVWIVEFEKVGGGWSEMARCKNPLFAYHIRDLLVADCEKRGLGLSKDIVRVRVE